MAKFFGSAGVGQKFVLVEATTLDDVYATPPACVQQGVCIIQPMFARLYPCTGHDVTLSAPRRGFLLPLSIVKLTS